MWISGWSGIDYHGPRSVIIALVCQEAFARTSSDERAEKHEEEAEQGDENLSRAIAIPAEQGGGLMITEIKASNH